MICKRRMLYLWNILNRAENELLKRFYDAQNLVKSKSDWVELIENDKKELDITLSDNEIKLMKEQKFENIINTAAAKKTLDYLNKIADSHSKSKILVKFKLERESYLYDPRFSRSEIELLFRLRTRMLDVKNKFANKYDTDIGYKLCKAQVESQQHLLKCDTLAAKVNIHEEIAYEDIFKGVDKQLVVVKVYKKLFREREIILNDEELLHL